ncbi:MAG: hypothetical protein FWF08_00440 [Oscillospiraceae bacterium]|nr:hypothetical protein [Oscillospiraceae bacterium]
MKKKIIIIFSVLFSIFLSVISLFYFVKSQIEFTIPTAYPNGFVAKLKLPGQTRHVGSAGLGRDKFKTALSEKEVKDFYNSYFSGLKKVYYYADQTASGVAFYDEKQKTVFSGLEVISEGKNTIFFISYDRYNDIEWLAVE